MNAFRRRLRLLALDDAGTPAVEFALTFPALVLLVVGVIQFGMAVQAYAGVRNAVEVGARYAIVFQTASNGYPSDAAIRAKVKANAFGVDPALLSTPTVSHCAAAGSACVDVSLTYPIALNLGLYKTPSYTLSYSRRVYRQ
ncbi:MAG: pilus assembly protein [Alphaproteobacteria bacterium]|nr:pilus assembly protein [Alphaproteobacteria bacterium]